MNVDHGLLSPCAFVTFLSYYLSLSLLIATLSWKIFSEVWKMVIVYLACVIAKTRYFQCNNSWWQERSQLSELLVANDLDYFIFVWSMKPIEKTFPVNVLRFVCTRIYLLFVCSIFPVFGDVKQMIKRGQVRQVVDFL